MSSDANQGWKMLLVSLLGSSIRLIDDTGWAIQFLPGELNVYVCANITGVRALPSQMPYLSFSWTRVGYVSRGDYASIGVNSNSPPPQNRTPARWNSQSRRNAEAYNLRFGPSWDTFLSECLSCPTTVRQMREGFSHAALKRDSPCMLRRYFRVWQYSIHTENDHIYKACLGFCF